MPGFVRHLGKDGVRAEEIVREFATTCRIAKEYKRCCPVDPCVFEHLTQMATEFTCHQEQNCARGHYRDGERADIEDRMR